MFNQGRVYVSLKIVDSLVLHHGLSRQSPRTGIAWYCQGAVSECVKGMGGVNVQTSEAGLSRSLFVRLESQ